MTTRKSSAWLALLLTCLLAMPPVSVADDTELFTTSANPNVLLMLDTTGSMSTTAGGSSVGELDGSSPSNSRMDILWKVVYTLLNADLSIPGPTAVTISGRLDRARRWSSSTIDTNISNARQYQYVQVTNITGGTWSMLPDSGTVQIGSMGTAEPMAYTSRSGGSPYRLYFSSAKTFTYNHSQGTTVSYTTSTSYSSPYPTDHTEAMSSAFLNNLTTEDENLLKARLGLMTFTTNSTGTSIQINTRNPISSTAANAPPFTPPYQNIWSSVTSYAYPSGGTPTAQALNAAQGFFDTAYNSSQLCRQNFAVMITDGEDTMGGLDGATGSGYGPYYYRSGSSYSQTYSSGYSLNSDGWSGSYWDGTPWNNGQVARNNAVIQEAANLATHSPSATLFTIGVGVSDTTQPHLTVLREVLRRAAEQTNDQADATTFTAIGGSGDNTSRGAGRAFFASDATELSAAMRNAFQQITAGMYSFTAPTVASVRMTDRNYLYKASFSPAPPPETFWEGHLEALSITDNTMTSHWDAGTVLKSTNPDARIIYTSTTDNVQWSKVPFTIDNVTIGMLGVDNTAARDNVVNYVRGANHDNNAKLGDIFHSKPVVVGPPSRFFFDEGYSTAIGPSGTLSFVEDKEHRKRVVYVGTNDGMLHAFLSGTYQVGTSQYDTGTGAELFGYVPNQVLGNLESSVPGEVTRHGYFVDSSPRVADVWLPGGSTDVTKDSSEWRTVLIAGLRKGGHGYFALDVTDPDALDYPGVLWEFVDPTNVGESWSEPFIGKVKVMAGSPATARDRWVAIFGGGKSDDGIVGRSLVVLDIATGTPLKIFTIDNATVIDNVVPASPATVLDGAGYIKFAYVADLDGSVYKFDFRSPGTGSSYDEWRMKKIFQAPAGQPVYHRIEPGSSDPGETNRYLFFGTGDQENPVTNTGTGKFYAVKDTDAFWPGTPLTESNLANLSSSITSLTGGSVGVTQYGWYVNFASVPSTTNDSYTHAGEKVLSDPVVFYNNVYFTTFTPDTANPCGGGGIARVYGLQMQNAGAGLASIAALGETSTTKVPYHVYSGGEGGIPSSPSLSIYPSGQSSIFVGFSTGVVKEIKIESPPQMKTIKSWKEMF